LIKREISECRWNRDPASLADCIQFRREGTRCQGFPMRYGLKEGLTNGKKEITA
jgi:hypothetical protein